MPYFVAFIDVYLDLFIEKLAGLTIHFNKNNNQQPILQKRASQIFNSRK